MNYCEDREGLYLCGVCSLPIAVGQKVCNAGKTMFLQLFKDALNNDFECINLITGFKDYFNVVKKYRNLGFKVKKNKLTR